MTWTFCSTPPSRDGYYTVQRYTANGELYGLPDEMRFNGEWTSNDGLPVMPYDKYLEIGGGK